MKRQQMEMKAMSYLEPQFYYIVKDIEDLNSFIEWVKAGEHPKDYWVIEEYKFPVELAITLRRR